MAAHAGRRRLTERTGPSVPSSIVAQTPEVAGPPDTPLAGAPQPRRLVREIMADPARIRRLDVVGPGGHGKTVLLDAIARVHRGTGATVIREVPAPGVPLDEAVLVVDDAHLLPDADLRRLAEIAATDTPLVVAHRPWPRSAALAALGVRLAAQRPPLVLEPLEPAGVAARAARLLPDRPRRDLVEHVLARTAGVPALVDRLLAALVALAPANDPLAVPLPARPPAGLVAQLGYAAAALDAGVRDLLLARAVGASPDLEVLGALLADQPVAELAEAARAAGLLAADGAAIPLVSAAVLAGATAPSVLKLRRALAETELRRGGDVLRAARGLLGSGATGARMVELFVAAGDAALVGGDGAPVGGAVRPASAGTADAAEELYAAAVAAGAVPLELAARRAEAALLAGRLDDALAAADQVLAAADRVEIEDAVRAGRVAAAGLAHRGLLARSAQLYRWLGSISSRSAGADAVLAVAVLVGTGALDEAREALRPPAPAPGTPPRPPTLSAGAEELMAQGVLDSVAGTPASALSHLARAAALLTSSRRAAVLPDTPAALTALVALQSGEIDLARSVLDAVVTSGLGGRATAARHLLLQAWIIAQRGAGARALLDAAADAGPLEPRDELLAAALEVALARRASDLAGLHAVWGRARESLVRHPVDLYSLPLLGELLVGAARLREQDWVRPHLDQAWTILGRLGSPPLWTAPLHWSCLQAAVAAGDVDTAERQAGELAELARSTRYAGALAGAAREWLRVLGGDVDAVAVDGAARGLHAVGLTWEGGRLAGQAAIRAEDRRDMATLLGTARALQGPGPASPSSPQRPAPRRSDGRTETSALDDAPGTLSGREREVAALVVQGMTYKQIGEQLFISAKTVEHHIARMRQRLGSSSRGELLAQLRQVVGKS